MTSGTPEVGSFFKDFATFRPTLRPMDVIQAGSFGGCGLLHACIRSQRTQRSSFMCRRLYGMWQHAAVMAGYARKSGSCLHAMRATQDANCQI